MTTVGDREMPAKQCTSTRPDDSRTESDKIPPTNALIHLPFKRFVDINEMGYTIEI